MNLSFQIPQFAGPLDLLLHLIRKEEMNVLDIDIQKITSQYLNYIKNMRKLDLEGAGDFITMAATLLHIKSRMLLPPQEQEDEEGLEDPRQELVSRLLEYESLQKASDHLYNRSLLGRDVFKRGQTESFQSPLNGKILLDEGGLLSLMAFYRGAVLKIKKSVHQVARKSLSVAQRIGQLKGQLVLGRRLLFRDLIPSTQGMRSQVIVTFLSLLELGKMGYISLYQSGTFSDIYLETQKVVDENLLVQVTDYGSLNQGASDGLG